MKRGNSHWVENRPKPQAAAGGAGAKGEKRVGGSANSGRSPRNNQSNEEKNVRASSDILRWTPPHSEEEGAGALFVNYQKTEIHFGGN